MAERILITGARGMLGRELADRFKNENYDIIPTDIKELDITDPNACESIISAEKPKYIINAAAYTFVDKAEEEPDKAIKINGDGAGNLAQTAKKIGAFLIHFSTDYIFSGRKKTPYKEDDKPDPLSSYGRSKLEGEKRIRVSKTDFLIIRTEWLFGRQGNNFVRTIINKAAETSKIEVVNDQIGSPTYAFDLAEATFFLLKKRANGIVNFTNSGTTSWFDFAKLIFERLAIKNIELVPISTEYLNRPAKRPLNSALYLGKYEEITKKRPRKYEDALESYLCSFLIR